MLKLQFYVVGVNKHDPKSDFWNAQIRIYRNEQHVAEFSFNVTAAEAQQLQGATGKMSETLSVKF